MTTALAEQPPWWEPGTRVGYHVNTFGFLVDEVLRRVDGRTLGQFMRDELVQDLGIDFHVSLPPFEDERVAEWMACQPVADEEPQRP